VYRDVYEADFASLFPNIMVEKNISPETVCCNCCNNRRTPELGYSICEKKEGFIGKVLQPLIEHRQQMKDELGNIRDESRRRYVEGSIDAIKWILVSCFGYMGHSHASYGAIRCHQAIQAFDRDIMLKAKESFEKSGYSVAHGIIDSIWVQEDEPTEEFEEVCRHVSDNVGIELEPEYKFEWCAFVPRKNSRADISTLNRYFGKKKGGELKTAGIEVEQDSVSSFVKDAQIEMIEALDREMSVEDVINVVKRHVTRLESNDVPVDSLVKRKKTSKKLEDYKVENRTVSALRRAKKHNIDVKPGEEIKFVVRNDSAKSLDRTRLEFESSEGDYDPGYYSDMLITAAESVTSPLDVGEDKIKDRLFGRDSKLTQYTGI
jgi:DNA polymerase elongation subunit (family B)